MHKLGESTGGGGGKPVAGFCAGLLFCYALRCVLSIFAIILVRKRDLLDLLNYLPGVL